MLVNIRSLLIAGLAVLASTASSAFTFNSPDQALLPSLIKAYTGEFSDRTNLKRSDGKPIYVNRMILEGSPYLRQHAHNPVDWMPWSADTLARAKAEDKLIFLSIGYATCHWCHVMEKESFDNEAIAAQMNADFISIKVDREQYPDVDLLYMTALQLTAETAGWPLSAVLLPDGKPVFTASYMRPAEFQSILLQAKNYWLGQRDGLIAHGNDLSEMVESYMNLNMEAEGLDAAMASSAMQAIVATFDKKYGGMGGAPKFPREPTLMWMLDVYEATGDETIKQALVTTLDKMQGGGIHDQIGGGFHRYAVDRKWVVPHFEKMLYNQAQLLEVYARGYFLFGDQNYKRTAERLVAFLTRELQNPETGLFYAGLDADSEGGEGIFYLWSEAEVAEVLGQDAAPISTALDIDDHFYDLDEKSVPTFTDPTNDPALLDPYFDKLWAKREQRPRPFLDKKQITAWNAQMISALALAGRLFAKPAWLEKAEKAGEALWQRHWDADLAVLNRFSLPDRLDDTPATLQDYAFLAQAYLRLSDEAASNQDSATWLARAQILATAMKDFFWMAEDRLYASQSRSANALFAQPIDTMDGSQPSDSATAMKVLIDLAQRSQDFGFERHAKEALAGMGGRMAFSATGHATGWRAAQRIWDKQLGYSGMAVGSSGVVKAKLVDGGLEMRLADGWHINSLTPRQPELIATAISLNGQGNLFNLKAPLPKLRQVDYYDEPVEELSGAFTVSFEREAKSAGYLEIDFQACNKEICLLPETRRLRLPD